jgi:hypothetical protein
VAVQDMVERRPAARSGKADALREETSEGTLGAAGVWVQARWERFAEIMSGRSYSQQGLVATCKDPVCEGNPERGEGLGLAHEPVGAMKAESRLLTGCKTP